MNQIDNARKLIKAVGGVDNIDSVLHCTTRLRFNVKSRDAVDEKAIESIEGSKGVMFRTNQLQVIFGSGLVNDMFDAVEELLKGKLSKNNSVGKKSTKKGIGSQLLDTFSSIFAPIVPMIVGAGMLMGIVYILGQTKVLDRSSGIFIVLNTFANAAFYFLPIYLGFSSARVFKSSPFLGALIGAILVHPNLIVIAKSAEPSLNVIGIPMMLVDYSSSVLPVILSVYVMSKIEKGLNKIIPDLFKVMIVPVLTIILTGLLALFLVAPLGALVGDYFAQGFVKIYNSFGMLGGLLFSGLRPFVLATGMNVAFTPISIMNIEQLGYDYIFPLTAAANTAMATSALYVFIHTKNNEEKSLAASSALSGFIGVTEPALFGFVLKYKKALISTIIGGGIGGAIMGLFQVRMHGMALVPLGGILLAVGPTFTFYLLAVAVSFIATFALLHFSGLKKELSIQIENEKVTLEHQTLVDTVYSPVSGKVIPLEAVGDLTFADKVIGDGIAIIPDHGNVYAPVSGTISALYQSNHAFGITSTSGEEYLIHIGIDTVNLQGKGFERLVKQGDSVQKGDLIIQVDLPLLEKEKYDPTVCIINLSKHCISFDEAEFYQTTDAKKELFNIIL